MFACHSTARNHKNFWSFFEAIFKRTQYLRNGYHTFLFEFWSGFYTKMWSLVNYENHYNLTNMFLPNPTSNRSLSYKSFIFFLLALDCWMCELHLTIIHMQKFCFLTLTLIITNILKLLLQIWRAKILQFKNFSRLLLYQFKYFHMIFNSTTHVCKYS